MNNIYEISGECTGCSACSVICPSKAISMVRNEEGFFSPRIDNSKCVSCGLCKQVCEKNTNFKKTPYLKTHALQTKSKELLLESSSGGVASTLSQIHIKNGGYVLGAYFDTKTNIVDTKISKDIVDLEKFKKSKYLQSYFYHGLASAIEIARKDKTSRFLVFGTPCQIAGAANVCDFYQVKDQFILVDFFCHGVPSYHVWDYYLSDKKINKEDLKYVSFRDKAKGWQSCFVMDIKYDDKALSIPSGKDDFYNAFFDNVFLMKSCYKCKFRKGYSKSDIRLGDYWGGRYSKNNDGVSSVLIYSDKGLSLVSENDFVILPSGEDLFFAQSTDDYSEIQLRNKAFSVLSEKKSLSKAIRQYRKDFPLKRRLKLLGKRVAYTILPIKIINIMKGKKWK